MSVARELDFMGITFENAVAFVGFMSGQRWQVPSVNIAGVAGACCRSHELGAAAMPWELGNAVMCTHTSWQGRACSFPSSCLVIGSVEDTRSVPDEMHLR